MGQLEYDNRGYTRLSLELPRDVMEEVEALGIKWGLISRGAIIERLLRELLIEEPSLKKEI
jgi:metal-responsive CopG/Arc/MetJ family transcriptional regulator